MPTVAPILMGLVHCVTVTILSKYVQCIFLLTWLPSCRLTCLPPRSELVLHWTTILGRIPIPVTDNGGLDPGTHPNTANNVGHDPKTHP